MANMIEMMEKKYTVIKNEDVMDYLDDNEVIEFSRLIARIMAKRMLSGKKPESTYLVVNTDEVYANHVVDILKSNGHWGFKSE